MMMQWIPLKALQPHPDSTNRMSLQVFQRLEIDIGRTGRYEALVVRPIEHDEASGRHYQILNGHRRAEVLRGLGHTQARCDVWEVDDDEARRLVTLKKEYEAASEPARPSMQLRPRLFVDGDQWGALHGENLQDGVAGFGDTPDAAYRAFDVEWLRPLAQR